MKNFDTRQGDGFNRHLTFIGKRRHRGITRFPPNASLMVRLQIESARLDDYHKRVGQGRYKK